MKSETVLLVVVGLVAFMMLQQRPGAQLFTAQPVATVPPAGQPDTFNNILGTIQSVFDTVGTIVKTQPATT